MSQYIRSTSIHWDNGALRLLEPELPLATIEQFELGDCSIASIFEAVEPGEIVQLQEGFFVLDRDLDLLKVDWKILALDADKKVVWEGGPHNNYDMHLELVGQLNQENPELKHEIAPVWLE